MGAHTVAAGGTAGSGAGYGILAAVVLALVLGYLVSLRLHPLTSCRACGGRGRNRGAFYRYSIGNCSRCGGSGRKARFGVRLFGSGDR